MLAAQTFAGNQLIRGGLGRRLDGILSSGDALFALVADRNVAVTSADGGATAVSARCLPAASCTAPGA